MAEVRIIEIPAHIVYTAEYDVDSLNDFFNPETGENILYDLQYLMEDENPDVHVPEDGEDYNYFDFPFPDSNGKKRVVYHDMVDTAGKDNPDGKYRFQEVPEVTAAALMYKGPYDSIGDGFDRVLEWIEANGYVQSGIARASAVNGPWDRDDEADYVTECQVPVVKR